jgi:hypothetical protein
MAVFWSFNTDQELVARFRSKMGSGTARGRRYLPPSEQAGNLPADSTSKGGLAGPACALEHAHCHVAQSQTLSPVSVHVRPAFCCCSRRISIEPRSREAKGDFIRRGRQRSPAQKSARLVLSSVIATRSPEQRYNQGIFRQVQSARCVGSEKGSSVMRILGKV